MPVSETIFDAATIAVAVFRSPHGVVLDVPLALLDVDALPASHRLDLTEPYTVDVNQYAIPGESGTFTGPWRSCTAGLLVVVDVVAGCRAASVYLETSTDGADVLDAVCVGNLQAGTRTGVSFTPSTSYYRVAVAPSSACSLNVRSQQRA